MPICAICGRDVETVTPDHIPPECLMAGIPDDQLIKVPGCQECNQGSSKDDEYFRMQVFVDGASQHPTAIASQPAARRALNREKGKGFRNLIYGSLRPVPEFTPSGLLVPGMKFDANYDRIARSARKIVRGLFYHIKGYPVPENYWVMCDYLDVIPFKYPDFVVKQIEEIILPVIVPLEATIIGPEAFCYRHGYLESDPNVFFVLFELYNRFQFFGFTPKKGSATP